MVNEKTDDKKVLVEKYFEDKEFVQNDIESFNNFVEEGMQEIVDENQEAEPSIIPESMDEFLIKFGDIEVGTPQITEGDASTHDIMPSEARLREISYSAPIYLDITTYVDGSKNESFTAKIGRLPIMLKSDYCHLKGMDKEELIENNEDPADPGGYFIINGTEKVLINVEGLAPNKNIVKEDDGDYTARLFSDSGEYKVLHNIEREKDGLFTLSFSRANDVPLILVIKALGLVNDQEISQNISGDKTRPEVMSNLYEFNHIQSQEEALDELAEIMNISGSKDSRRSEVQETLNTYLLPHVGIGEEYQGLKAFNLCKVLKKYLRVSNGELEVDDKDHYKNKQIKLAGDLLKDLFRANFNVLVSDLIYNFQRMIKRGKLPSVKVIIRDKLLTSRIHSAMATGEWVGDQTGVCQRMQRVNSIETMSHLQRVVSPLSAKQESFAARALHSTHLGRLGPIETPEGTNIGLRKNLALLCQISQENSAEDEEKLLNECEELGLERIE